MNPRWGPRSDVNNPRITRGGQWENAAFGYLDETGNPSSWNAWSTLLEGAAEGYAGPLQGTPWVSDPGERQRIAAFERAVMGRLNRDSSLPTSSDDGRAIVSQENYARAVVAQRTWEAFWGTGSDAQRDAAQEEQAAGPDDPPNPYSRPDAPPNGWSYGQWVFARLLHQELAALDPPISIEPHHLVGTEGRQLISIDHPAPLMAWTRARGRWELFGMMDEQWGPLSSVVGRSRTSDGLWRDAAFGFVDEGSYPALWDRWNARVRGAANAYPEAGITLNWTPFVEDLDQRRRIATFEMEVMERALLTPGGRHRVSQDNYDQAVVAQRAEEREADRAVQVRAERASAWAASVLGPSPHRQPSVDYTDRVRQNAERRNGA